MSTTEITRTLALYEPAMCCESGVCGPSVDEQLLTIREDLRWAHEHGATVARHNLSSDPDAFVANPKVTSLMQALGEKALPALVVDGEIHTYGRYPTRDELASIIDQPAPVAAETSAPSKSCGCSGDC